MDTKIQRKPQWNQIFLKIEYQLSIYTAVTLDQERKKERYENKNEGKGNERQ